VSEKMAEFEENLAREIADIFREHVAAETKALRERIDALERRNLEVESQAAEFRYRGVWQPSEQYWKNNFITHDGSVWICLRETEGKPGQSLDWQLAVRRGRDGKDANGAAR
jgi:hypothetical protein